MALLINPYRFASAAPGLTSLFGGGDDGFYYDFTNTANLYQTEDTSTPVTAAGQSIGRATDLSGKGRHGTMATSSNRSIYRASPNSFSGNATTTAVLRSSGISTTQDAWTMAVAATLVSTPTTNNLSFCTLYASNTCEIRWGTDGKIGWQYYDSSYWTTGTYGSQAVALVMTCDLPGDVFKFFINGTEVHSIGFAYYGGASVTHAQMWNWGGLPFLGKAGDTASNDDAKIGAMLWIDRALTGTDLATLHTGMGNHVGLSI